MEPGGAGADQANARRWRCSGGCASGLRPGGCCISAKGKWYPGEPLPRWAFHCISRVDGVPVWEDVELIARKSSETGFGLADSLRFLQALTRRLQVSADSILPAFDSRVRSGADGVHPAAAPASARGHAWRGRASFGSSGRSGWFCSRETRRSATASRLSWCRLSRRMSCVEPRRWRGREAAGASGAAAGAVRDRRPSRTRLPPLSPTAESAPELVRPALCVQAVAGRLHVFLPYTPVIADYLDLVAAVEDTCTHLQMPVWLEGYPPPHDPRLRSYGLTPDPGVLEVNLPPTADWDALEELNATLHEEAHGDRLIAGKFAYDGSHLSTGGGSHIVLGRSTVMESPVLRRPDLLRSMVTFWQRHPSLSYLFSGMYVGPTSQYPRVDEARVDALYELEVAFSQLTAECSAVHSRRSVPQPAGGCDRQHASGGVLHRQDVSAGRPGAAAGSAGAARV